MPDSSHAHENNGHQSVDIERRVYRLEVAWFGEGEHEGARADLKALRADMAAVKTMLTERKWLMRGYLLALAAIATKVWWPGG